MFSVSQNRSRQGSTRIMCCDDKCLFFINVRTGSLIFGYIAAVISGFGVLACIGVLLTFLTRNIHLDLEGVLVIQMLFLNVAAGVTCTVLLLFGLTKNKPVLVKTYVIYGMIQLAFLICVDFMLFGMVSPLVGILVFIACGIYGSLVYMVYLAYKEMIQKRVREAAKTAREGSPTTV